MLAREQQAHNAEVDRKKALKRRRRRMQIPWLQRMQIPWL